MKRRLKNEVSARKKGGPDEEQAAKEFEESLMRLASFAKGRIKYEDFTSKDKFNILDLFVNNEKTLVRIYEALFPHRAGSKGLNLGPSVSGSPDRSIGRYGYHSGVAANLVSSDPHSNMQSHAPIPSISNMTL